MKKLKGLRRKIAKTFKKRFFEKILQREGVTITFQKANLGSMLEGTLMQI